MFYNIFDSILNGIRTFANDAANYLKCRSMCCNNINVYNPKSCCIQGEIFNKFTRTRTPSVEAPIARDKTAYFTPKINNI